MKLKLKDEISNFREQLTSMLNDHDLQDDEVYSMSLKLDKLIIEYQRKMKLFEFSSDESNR